MNKFLVIGKTESGIIIPCKPTKEPDGMSWACGNCAAVCCRVSFGIMNGLWRCHCGIDIEIYMDDKKVDVSRFDTPTTPAEAKSEPLTSDEEFLKLCGIAVENNEPQEG